MNYQNHFKEWLSKNVNENRTVRDKTPEKDVLQSPSNIVFENNELKLIVEKGTHRREKNFRLQDHLFYFRIQTNSQAQAMPLLVDILDFLHAAFIHVLDSIKSFYEQGY